MFIYVYIMSQMFKKKIPPGILYNFLDENSWKHELYYTMDSNSYKKAKFNNNIKEFFSTIKEYYHVSKRYYVEREDTYNNLLTVIRQICKGNSVAYSAIKRYEYSSYKISYNIYK